MIDLLRGQPSALAYARAFDRLPFCSEITRTEVLRGLRSDERRATERLFGAVAWIGVDEPIARRAGELGRAFRRSHQGIGTADLIIAATAQEFGHDLATLNIRHFPMFPDLLAPYEP